MTPTQRDRIKAVIAQDADGSGRLYYSYYDTYCVMGGLGKAIGIPNERMMGGSLTPQWTRGNWGYNSKDTETIAAAYGLTYEIGRNLIRINDNHLDLGPRRKALIQYVDTLEVE